MPDPWAEFRAMRAQLNFLTERLFHQAPARTAVADDPAPRVQGPRVAVGLHGMEEPDMIEPRVAARAGDRKISYLTVMDHMSKLGTKYFRGGPYPLEADEWRTRMERNFQSTRCPEDYRTDIAVHFLEGDAHTWWEGVVARQGRRDLSWVTFREEFTRKYFPPEAQDRLECAFLELQQGTRTVREYEEEFNRLRRYAGKDMEDDSAQVRRFMRGLRIDIRNRCLVRNYTSIGELVEKAALLEAGMEEERKLRAVRTQPSSGTVVTTKGKGHEDKKRKWEAPKGQMKGPITRKPCGTCGKMHGGECWLDAGKGAGNTCFHCGKEGHYRRECPKLAVESSLQQQDREREALPPPPKRPAIGPRLYAMNEEVADYSDAKPITGLSE